MTSFEDAASLAQVKTSNSIAALSTTGVSDGASSLAVTFKATPTWSMVTYTPSAPLNLQTASGITFEMVNPASAPVPLIFSAIDTSGNEIKVYFTAGTAGLARIFLPFSDSQEEFGLYYGVPPTSIFLYRWLNAVVFGPFDPSRVASVRWAMKAPSVDTQVYLDFVRVISAQDYRSRLFGISDRYGQFAKASFAGELVQYSEFATRRAQDKAELAENPGPANRDAYGGNLNGPNFGATGFFGRRKYNGKWWLTTPLGNLYYGIGVTSVTYDNRTPITGREYMFEYLPGPNDPLYIFRGPPVSQYGTTSLSETFNFVGANLHRKYGSGYDLLWLASSKARIKSWGLNLVGAGSSPRMNASYPWLQRINVGGPYDTVDPGWITHEPLPDPYDPAFEIAVREAAAASLPSSANDPMLIGVMIEQEPSWRGLGEENGRYDVARAVLGLDSATSPAKEAMILFLQGRYSTIQALNTKWGTSFSSFADLADPSQVPTPLDTDLKIDFADFTYEYAKKYFTVCRKAMRSYDTNHLYMGCQLSGYTEEVIRACADVADVIAPTYYKYRLQAEDKALFAKVDRPFLFPEFSFGTTDRGLHGGLVPVNSQAFRAVAYRTYMKDMLLWPQIVGACFFRYNDQPITGNTYGEGANTGILDVTDTPYSQLVDVIRETSYNIYNTRRF
ncbi:MAG: beta-galactosidase [Fimbriimonas sp.]